MKKLLSLLLTVAMLATSLFALASCGDEKDPEPTETEVTYTVVVKDQYGEPVKGVIVKIGDTQKVTNDNGKITLKTEKGDYKVTVADVPEDYSIPNSIYNFDSNNIAEIVIQTSKPQVAKVDYTIYVKTADGTPVAGAKVQICADSCIPIPALTDSEGKVVTSQKEGEYEAKLLTPPTGYKSNDTYYAFNSNNVATIIIEAE